MRMVLTICLETKQAVTGYYEEGAGGGDVDQTKLDKVHSTICADFLFY